MKKDVELMIEMQDRARSAIDYQDQKIANLKQAYLTMKNKAFSEEMRANIAEYKLKTMIVGFNIMVLTIMTLLAAMVFLKVF